MVFKKFLKIILFMGVLFVLAEIALRVVYPELENYKVASFYIGDRLSVNRFENGQKGINPDTGESHAIHWDKYGVKVHGSHITDTSDQAKTVLLIGDELVENRDETSANDLSILMTRILNAVDSSQKWQVLNASLGESTTDQQYLMIRQILKEIKPTWVLHFFNPNDLEELQSNDLSHVVDGKLSIKDQGFPIFQSIKRCYVSRLCSQIFSSGHHQNKDQKGSIKEAFYAERRTEKLTHALGHYLAVIDKERELLWNQAAELIVVEAPTTDIWLNPDAALGNYLNHLQEVLEAVNVPLKPLKPAFETVLDQRTFSDNRSRCFFEQSDSWNKQGNLLVAIELTSMLVGKNVLEVPAVQKLLPSF